jgi:hypothetical protein
LAHFAPDTLNRLFNFLAAQSYADFLSLFSAGRLKKTPSLSPFTQASSQRRNADPVDDNSRKNSFNGRPSSELSTLSLAPVSEISSSLQARRQVPSMAII